MNPPKTEKENEIASHIATGEHATKKRYVKPEARFERVFETMALSCGKTGPTNASCRTNRQAS
jgi:hypothetical protein